MIVATAGHVDHGKTSLIAALTGVDTDRLPEEKARGLTVDLGFAYLPLPTGHVIGFIDVPGHERFVRNMVAGIAGIDMALLVVAADDGVMPQTREHVAVLDLLGVERAAVALTKVDRADPVRVAEVGEAIRTLLAGTGISPIALIETAAPLGKGIDSLHRCLSDAAEALDRQETQEGFRLAVDRSFVVRGAGVVVTGTVHGGMARVGDKVVFAPSGLEARIRGIHAQDRPSEVARRGDRAALNLAGIAREDVVRGDWVLEPDILRPARRVDLSLRVLEEEPRALKHWTPVHVHHGAGHTTGRVAILQGGALDPGVTGLVQLVLDDPLATAFGDRVVLRDQSARRTLAGGRVIDPFGPERGRARPERLDQLAAMDRSEPRDALAALLAVAPNGVALGDFLKARNRSTAHAAEFADLPDAELLGRGDRQRLIARTHWSDLQAGILAGLAADHTDQRDRLGPNMTELRRYLATRPDDALLEEALQALAREGAIERRGAIVHLPGHTVELDRKDATLWQKVETALTGNPGSPPALFPLADALDLLPGDLERFLQRMAGFGLVVKIARNRYLTTAQVGQACEHARAAASADDEAQFRDVAGIGRNLAVDLVEFLDRFGVTQRRGDRRFLTRPQDGVSS
jgi:selenocysteine-specific elongation factor